MALIDVAMSAAIALISLVALAQVIPVAVMATTQGNQVSTAIFLAEQRIEEIKAWTLSTATSPVQQGFETIRQDGSGTCHTATTGPCRDQAYNSIAGYPTFRRAITITDNPDGITDTKSVVITVFFRLPTPAGLSTSESSARISALVAR